MRPWTRRAGTPSSSPSAVARPRSLWQISRVTRMSSGSVSIRGMPVLPAPAAAGAPGDQLVTGREDPSPHAPRRRGPPRRGPSGSWSGAGSPASRSAPRPPPPGERWRPPSGSAPGDTDRAPRACRRPAASACRPPHWHPAADGAVEIVRSPCRDDPGESAGEQRGDGTHLHHHRAGSDSRRYAVGPLDGGLHRLRVGQYGDHHVARGGQRGCRCGGPDARRNGVPHHVAGAVEDLHREARREDTASHTAPHPADTDETDGHPGHWAAPHFTACTFS